MAVAVSSALAGTTTFTVTGPGGESYAPIVVTTPADKGFGPGFPDNTPCPVDGYTSNFLVVSGVPATDTPMASNERLTGQIFAEYVVPNGRIEIPGTRQSIDQVGGIYTGTIQIPSSNQWLGAEIHLTAQLEVQDATVPGYFLNTSPQIGGGQDLFSAGCLVKPPLGTGTTATIGFWNNKNGQAIINAFNGGPTSKALSKWLSSTFPNLYGCLKNQTNAQIAALFQTDFNVSGPKYDAQVLATALAVYATNTNLGGSALATQYGFTVNSTGTGALLFNVGANGAAVGVPNYTTLSILDILKGVDAQSQNCVLDGKNLSLLKATNVLFSEINQNGDIK
jgi:hypothetical protein